MSDTLTTQKEIPRSGEELTVHHHIAYYTFLPMAAISVLAMLLAIPVWAGSISTTIGAAVPWIGLLTINIYMYLFGDYIIPIETYRGLRSRE